MATTINFLRDRHRRLTKQQALDQKIFKITTAVGGICLALLLLTLGIRLFMAYQLQQLNNQENRLLAEVRSQEDSEKSYVIFAAKLNVLSQLFAQRRDKQEALEYFTTLFGPDVLVSDVAYDADIGVLTLGLKANNIFTLQTVFDQLRSDEVKSQFASVTASELRRDDQGSYQTTVTISLKEKGSQ